jgi:hypothetical protein
MGRVCYVLGKITNSFWGEQASQTIFLNGSQRTSEDITYVMTTQLAPQNGKTQSF